MHKKWTLLPFLCWNCQSWFNFNTFGFLRRGGQENGEYSGATTDCICWFYSIYIISLWLIFQKYGWTDRTSYQCCDMLLISKQTSQAYARTHVWLLSKSKPCRSSHLLLTLTKDDIYLFSLISSQLSHKCVTTSPSCVPKRGHPSS